LPVSHRTQPAWSHACRTPLLVQAVEHAGTVPRARRGQAECGCVSEGKSNQRPNPPHSAVTCAFAPRHGSDGPVGRLLVIPAVAVAAVELNKVTAASQKRSHPLPCAYSGACGGRSLWGKRPAHSATRPGYRDRRTGLTLAVAYAHDLTCNPFHCQPSHRN
jgi:hypothetical protein